MLTLLQLLVSAIVALATMVAGLFTAASETAPARPAAIHGMAEPARDWAFAPTGVGAPALHTGNEADLRLALLSAEEAIERYSQVLDDAPDAPDAPAVLNHLRRRPPAAMGEHGMALRPVVVIHRCSLTSEEADKFEPAQPRKASAWTTYTRG